MPESYLSRFANLERDEKVIQVTSVTDPQREGLNLKLRAFSHQFRLGRLENDSVNQAIAKLVLDLRNLVGSPEYLSQHWQSTSEAFQEIVGFVRSYADEETINSLTELLESLESLIDSGDREYPKTLENTVKEHDYSMIVVPKSWQVFQLEVFLADTGLSETPVTYVSPFFSSASGQTGDVLFLTAPNRLRPHHLRNLFFGGSAQNVHFLTPGWQLDKNLTKLVGSLFPENMVVRPIVFDIIGEVSDEPVIDDEIETIKPKESLTSVPYFKSTGNTECRLIELSEELVYPIELSATRVSVLAEDPEGGIDVTSVNPFEELSPGDIVFELKNGVDEDFLLDAVKADLGADYFEFKSIHARWKNVISKKLQVESYESMELQLAQSGVMAANQIKNWLENPSFVSPRSNSDWQKLLEFSGFSKQELARALQLTKKIRSSLISFGQSARKMMSEEISTQEMERVGQGEVLLKSLPDFGDAVFAIATVTNVPIEIFSCQPNQIRTLMRKPND